MTFRLLIGLLVVISDLHLGLCAPEAVRLRASRRLQKGYDALPRVGTPAGTNSPPSVTVPKVSAMDGSRENLPRPAPRSNPDAPELASRALLAAHPASAPWKVLWQDHFDKFDTRKWSHQLYDGCQYDLCGWGNQELSWYTRNTSNVRVSNNKLVIEAREETGAGLAALQQECWDECGTRCARQMQPGQDTHSCVLACGQGRCPQVRFTSGRVRTYGKFRVAPSARYGTVRIEARMALPRGSGLWPAFWMLPEVGASEKCSGCGVYGAWPASGEIDIMESVNEADSVFGSIHYGGHGPNHNTRSASTPLSAGFHTFAIEWQQHEIRWYLDGKLYSTARSKGAALNGWWSSGRAAHPTSPFDVPFYLIINLAVGGIPPGSPSPDAVAQTMAHERRRLVVDFVQVLGR